MRVAIFGMGSIGRRHATNLREMGGHELLICDPADVKPLPGLYSLTRDVNVAWEWKPEAVLICTPPDSHAALALAAIRQRIHTFIEKPVAANIADADLIRWEADNSGVQLAIGYQLAWQLGDVPSGKDVTWECSQDMSQWPSRYGKDVLLEFSHEIAAARYVNGPVEAVVAQEDEFGWFVRLRHFDCLNTVHINPRAHVSSRSCYADRKAVWAFDQAKNDQAYKDELQAFLEACDGESFDNRLCTGAQAAHVIRIIEAAKQSARDCKVVTI